MSNRRLAVVSGLAVLSAVAFAPKAGAQTVDIDFGGNITGTCAFTGTTGGTLGTSSPSAPFVEASGGTAIGSTGAAGTTTVNCTSGGQVTVAAPVQVAAPAGFTENTRQAVVFDGTANTTASTGSGTVIWGSFSSAAPLTIPANTNRSLKVAMNAGVEGNTGGVPSGTYTYKVTLTATPN